MMRKLVRVGKSPHLEGCSVKCVKQSRGRNIPVTGFLLKENAKNTKELVLKFLYSGVFFYPLLIIRTLNNSKSSIVLFNIKLSRVDCTS